MDIYIYTSGNVIARTHAHSISPDGEILAAGDGFHRQSLSAPTPLFMYSPLAITLSGIIKHSSVMETTGMILSSTTLCVGFMKLKLITV